LPDLRTAPMKSLAPPAFVPADYGFALVASCGFGYAITVNYGWHTPRAYQPLVFAGLLLLWRLLELGRRRTQSRFAGDAIWMPLVFVLLMLGWGAYEDPLIFSAVRRWPIARNGQLGLLVLLLSYVPFLLGAREPPWTRHLRFALFAAAMLVIGFDLLDASPRPSIDVWEMQQKAADLLREGKNPYRHLAIKDSYGNVAGKLPFVYPPTVLLTGLAGKLAFGDIRHANLFAIVLFGGALRSIARSAKTSLPAVGEDAAALMVWLQARQFTVLEQAWTDVIPLAFLAGGLALRLRGHTRAGVVVLGLALSAKQTMFWFVPLIFLYLDFRRRDWLILAATAAAVMLPFALWDFSAFWQGIVSVQLRLPPRPDAITFMAWWRAKYAVWPGSTWISWVAPAAVLGFGAWRLRGSLVAFALSAATIYFLFFFFQKHAFANYYYFVSALAALAAACSARTLVTAADRAA
jgi:hypothetical protein